MLLATHWRVWRVLAAKINLPSCVLLQQIIPQPAHDRQKMMKYLLAILAFRLANVAFNHV